MDKQKINTVVFDLGGVLVDWNPEYLYRSIFPSEEERRWFLSTVCTQDWNLQQDAGRSLQEGTAVLLQKFPDHETAIRAFYGRWTEMLSGPIQGTLEILRHLKSNTDKKLYALTNWSAETFPVALEMYDFLHWFDGRVVSGEEKMRKPDKAIYQVLINRYNITPNSSVYIDDMLYNVVAARELGFHGIHFQSPQQLKAELIALDVL
ncbi:HAD family hydrolase [Glaciimonas soli]|uniref:HAD-IA family hydrolase n=1 Tax=Glaciimonas soli TaxID=2590999 RepID=A0A843YN60_9BURK|nr:HAD family phosphatase [Glaciimonas soli]MQQ99416.1 HAD-IA family hydrolase [Glaciimonas soli]